MMKVFQTQLDKNISDIPRFKVIKYSVYLAKKSFLVQNPSIHAIIQLKSRPSGMM